jgi:hypothetical protein
VIGRRSRLLVVHAMTADNATFSYQRAWPRHFAASPLFETTLVDIGQRSWWGRGSAHLTMRRWRGDGIVLLHSVFSNSQLLAGRLLELVASRPEPKVFFIGNEYKNMPEKMQFCDALKIQLLVSQSSSPAVHALYRSRLGCAVTWLPNTGLDTAVFQPAGPADDRPIDLGYRSAPSPVYLGHFERESIAEVFAQRAVEFGLTIDISLDPSDRFDEPGWAAFLNRCKGQLGSEAGGDHFDLSDQTRLAMLAWERAHPNAPRDQAQRACADLTKNAVPLRIISGRHIEAAGTKTAQLLLEGDYDGLFVADEHYIALRKDFSTLAEAVEKFRDRGFRARVADNAYRVAHEQLTYPRLLDRFRGELLRALERCA